MEQGSKIFLIAGEASGDTYGAALMMAWRNHLPTTFFLGAGGPQMEAAALQQQAGERQSDEGKNVDGLQQGNRLLTKTSDAHQYQGISNPKTCSAQEELEDPNSLTTHPSLAAVGFKKGFDNWIEEAGVVGLWDVLKKYGYFRAKFSQFLEQLKNEKPDAIILIDYPGFNLRLTQAIRRRKLPLKIFYYISPQVWAWNKSRIPKMARLLDLMICIFPFEQKLYESSGLPTVFAGHPLVETIIASKKETDPLTREKHLLGLFPGSREREVHRLFPAMLQAAKQVLKRHPEISCHAAAATPAHAAMMQRMAQEAGLPITITTGKARELMQRATFGLVCSGTATLEAACYELPYALVYKVAWLTYIVGRQLIRVPFLGIINILAGRLIVQEFIQQEATAEALAKEALRFLKNPQTCEKLAQELRNVTSMLHGQGAYDRATATMIDILQNRKHTLHE